MIPNERVDCSTPDRLTEIRCPFRRNWRSSYRASGGRAKGHGRVSTNTIPDLHSALPSTPDG